MQLDDGRIAIEEKPEWQKIVYPAERNWLALVVYSILLLIWLGMAGFMLVSLFGPFGVEGIGTTFIVAWRLLLIFWLGVWIWFAHRWLWRYWQYYAASREILFLNNEELILRRPVSLLGITDVYDRQHISHIAIEPRQKGLTFAYGTRTILFGLGLTPAERGELAAMINLRYFPHYEAEDEDEDEV